MRASDLPDRATFRSGPPRPSRRRVPPRRLAAVTALAGLVLASCGLLSVQPGACVSDVAAFEHISDKVYCYNGWDRSECAAYDDEQVNGVGWNFHAGQSCADRGLVEGSNDWP